MQIGGSNGFGNDGIAAHRFNAGAATDQTAQDATRAGDDTRDLGASSPSQDDAVKISPQGYAATSASAADDNDNSDDAIVIDGDNAASTSPATASDTSDAADADDPSAETPAEANAQPVKSLVYGALGLDRPDQPNDPNHAYSAGQWIAAGITLGGIVSLFI